MIKTATGRLTMHGVSITTLIASAYEMPFDRISGPDWMMQLIASL
jgi:uncharacterized protein (TIGR03435 family)